MFLSIFKMMLNAERCSVLPSSTVLFCLCTYIIKDIGRVGKIQGCGSAFISSGSGSSNLGWIPIRIQYGSWSNRDLGLNDQKLKLKKKFGSKTTIYLSLGLHKNVHVTEEAFSSQKRPSKTSKHEFFSILWVILPSWIRIRIHWPD
jgi:hypothetical protein